MEQVEIWKDVPGYDGEMQVSNMGRVRTFKPVGRSKYVVCRELRGAKSNGYLYVSTSLKGKRMPNKYVHRLVAETFLGPCPEGLEVGHIDENKENNRVDNLAYVTHGENMRMPGLRVILSERHTKYAK